MSTKTPLEILQSTKEIFSSRPHVFLQPPPALHSELLHLTKYFLDPLASNISEAQLARQKHDRQSRKRKRRDNNIVEEEMELLRMKKIYVEGFDVDQIWQQARKVLGATAKEVERSLPAADAGEVSGSEEDVTQGNDNMKTVRFDDDGFEVDESEEESRENIDEEQDDVEGGDPEYHSSEDEGSLDIGNETPPSDLSDDEDAEEVLVKDKHGLNDGFFSIDQFNKQTQFLEAQDARGDPDDGAASDEDDIDWGADPTTFSSRPDKLPRSQDIEDVENDEQKQDEDDDEDDEGGPTFGNMDLDAPEGDSDGGDDNDAAGDLVGAGAGDMGNTNNVLYADFFAPPAQAASKKKNRRQPTKRYEDRAARQITTAAPTEGDSGGEDEDLKRTMSGVHRDLFEDDLSEPDEPTPENPGTSKNANLSTHERAQLALRAEIRRLEAANVSSKPWSLTGESIAPARPINSLLEEDLDFERAGKPVPVITEEVSESIEDLIKRRIIAREFDEIIRRRPNDLVTGSDPRRGRVREELADTKPKQGLAEEYEQDHLRRTDPNYVDTRTEALKAVHKQIEAQWTSISAQLDALSNWHYKPRAPAPTLNVRVDAPTITLEDARPAAGGEVGGTSLLAPQEIYQPGEEGNREGEVLTRGGTAVAKEEETREAKKRRRAREKERAKKAAGNLVANGMPGGNASKGKSANKNEVVAQLKKGGAKIIDSKGAVKDVDGNAVREEGGAKGIGSFRL